MLSANYPSSIFLVGELDRRKLERASVPNWCSSVRWRLYLKILLLRSLKPSAYAECRKINSGRRIPPRRAVSGAKLHRDVLVPIRNPQWRPGYRIWLSGRRRRGIGASFAFPSPPCRPHRLAACSRSTRPLLVACFFCRLRSNRRHHCHSHHHCGQHRAQRDTPGPHRKPFQASARQSADRPAAASSYPRPP